VINTTDPAVKALIHRVMRRMMTMKGKTMLRGQLHDELFRGENLKALGIEVSVDADKRTGVLTVHIGDDKIEAVGAVLGSERKRK
jgi:hypothetical protein